VTIFEMERASLFIGADIKLKINHLVDCEERAGVAPSMTAPPWDVE